MIDNIVLILLILIYLTLVATINYYMNLNVKKKNNVKIGKKDIPAKLLYCYGVNSAFKLFKVTLLDLIDKGIYTLYDKDDKVYVKYNDNIEDIKLLESEKCVIEIVNSFMEKKNNNVTLNDIDTYFSSDWCYNYVVNYYYVDLKKEVLTSYGVVTKYLNYIGIFFISFLYFIQVFSFISYHLSTGLIIVVSIIFSILTIFISNKFGKYVDKVLLKNYVLFYILSIVCSIVAYFIWINNSNCDYLIVHFILGSFVFLYPLLIYTNILFSTDNRYFKNKKQEHVTEYIKNTKEDIKDKDDYTKRDYVFMIGLNMKYNVSDVVEKFKAN